jgi:hypothetical protein
MLKLASDERGTQKDAWLCIDGSFSLDLPDMSRYMKIEYQSRIFSHGRSVSVCEIVHLSLAQNVWQKATNHNLNRVDTTCF